MATPRSVNVSFRLLISVLLAVAAMASLLTGIGCFSGEPKIAIEAASAELSPVFLGVGSVFMTVRNEGGRDALIAASVNIPNALVELHDVRGRRMEKVERIRIPSRGAAELKPGGMHLMIYNMPRNLQEGAEVVLTLRFERSGERQVPVRFVKPAEP
jgi:copper(I)-binding protein